ncbi:NUDIX hydrolase [Gleimia sp. 6138-11-ORH1]|uniref:NUDIX hydrolase n=1 Tax=Gleimia sp. 6138-11-ORH1 TaxID=2973937 RepID=UPI0021679B5C|nr:NUDIX hydrolase [Gleimia sp. 6138-11-ORH1]MCS4484689.1 NUDIX hydrolase [Gleimia sp. 6138-11-ORH1]
MTQPRPTPGATVPGPPTPNVSQTKPVARRGSLTRPSPIPSRIVRSAGALVWRLADRTQKPAYGQRYDRAEIEVLLVHRPRYDDWSWPKGKAEVNEPLLAAGVREVEEETGIAVSLYAPMTAQRYRLGMGQTKEVYYWVGLPVTEENLINTRPPVTPAPKKEIDEARWVSPTDAREMLTRRGDKRLLDDLVSRAEAGQLMTATIALLSHAQCRGRNYPEASRTLSRAGTRQSIELIDMLSALGVTRLLSAPASRCKRTLEPYSTILGTVVSVAEELKLPAELSYLPTAEKTVEPETDCSEGAKAAELKPTKRVVPSPALFASRVGGQLKVPAVPKQSEKEPAAATVKDNLPDDEPLREFKIIKLDRTQEVIQKLLKHPGEPLAISAHPELIEHMLGPLVEAASINVARQFPEGNDFDQTAQLTIVHVAYPNANTDAAEVIAVETHRVPIRG